MLFLKFIASSDKIAKLNISLCSIDFFVDKCGIYSNSLNEKINFELNKTDLDGFIENLEKIEKVKLANFF